MIEKQAEHLMSLQKKRRSTAGRTSQRERTGSQGKIHERPS